MGGYTLQKSNYVHFKSVLIPLTRFKIALQSSLPTFWVTSKYRQQVHLKFQYFHLFKHCTTLFDEHCLARQCSSLLWQSCLSVRLSVCPSATNMRWWRCAKTVIARNTKLFLGIFLWAKCRFVLKSRLWSKGLVARSQKFHKFHGLPIFDCRRSTFSMGWPDATSP